jgi:hypothetical protein
MQKKKNSSGNLKSRKSFRNGRKKRESNNRWLRESWREKRYEQRRPPRRLLRRLKGKGRLFKCRRLNGFKMG